ncbi:NTE family protein [Pseudoxanthomonas japonensis]|uniref:patatin-like phospholipase family protein n=1 Tax=Pseudoxanthomonas japonensis TaxID=69284 RepID=UPI00285D9DE5|nr:patatin-like phospholipase family protein [Pseudoxanthomonas japonensis]MDR7070884.1 NTE family protein [Pseudoxanthomonas japonensis]
MAHIKPVTSVEKTALVLSGGGARASYQVGVLQGLVKLRRERLGDGAPNPFGILCGTSAGAINAAALACRADSFDAGVETIAAVWRNFRADQVYRTDALGIARSGAQWLSAISVGWMLARWRKEGPRSLLDNEPLAELLRHWAPLELLPRMLAERHLHALALGASSYTSGEHLTFFEATGDMTGYERSQRLAVPMRLGLEHLLASAAIPFVFPAQRIEHAEHAGWYGDGSMRQTSPISPAIHLGAQRMLIVGVGRLHEPRGRIVRDGGYPTLAQVGGHVLSNVFLDSLAVDIERMERVNRTLEMMTLGQRLATSLRSVKALVIAPSERIDDIAARHQKHLPRTVRALLRGVGSSSASSDLSGSALASYLLFEAPFTQEVMALGERDTLAQRQAVCDFFGWL